MHTTITADDLLAYHKATRCPLSDARRELLSMEPGLRARVLIASRTHDAKRMGLIDPIEQDPIIQQRVHEAGSRAALLVGGLGLGACHMIWAEQARILQEEYGITWYSPAKMNPGTRFD